MDGNRLAAELAAAGYPWPPPRTVASTASTNADLADLARAGGAEGASLVAEVQTAGRGRLGRSWESPPGAGLLFSVLLRPAATDPAAWGWLPLLAGVAVARGLGDATGLPLGLKWPNDVVVDGPDRGGGPGPRKLAGVLVERVGDARDPAAVVGVGIDVTHSEAELPVPSATSLALEGAAVADRVQLLVGVLVAFQRRYRGWQAAGGDAERCGLVAEYRDACLTLGREVRVVRAVGPDLLGRAADVDGQGRLLVAPSDGAATEAVAAGDVLHLR